MIPEESYDIIVIGAGPAGSTAATYAAQRGMSVLLVDKKKDIGVPLQCGGFLPHVETLQELIPSAELPFTLEEYPSSCIHATTSFQRFIAPNGISKGFEVQGDALDRRRFDKHLASVAAKTGAHLLIATNVLEVNRTEVTMDGAFGRYEVQGKVIIGADGPNSIVAASNGMVREPDPMGTSTAFEYELSDVDVDKEAVEMYFGKDYVPGGYAWIISQGGDRANIGVGIREALFAEHMCARDYLNKFMCQHPIASEKLKEGNIISVISGLVPVGGAPRVTATKDTLIAGDAAGHLIATNGGGISTAMVGGKLAGESASDFLEGKCRLEEYDRRWRAQMGLEIRTAVHVRKLMDRLMLSDGLMNTAIKAISPAQMKAIQCGQLPDPVKKTLQRLNMGMG
ncbi:geranylgeranyl reductase family protein [Methanomethylovorans hollandica DSM 15978]|uniref:Geranylgeranyl reductase family protein n=1 Tax=Methanomethylovorans hollandica (strain DSM 15978 / NBRC 107637 / DMS1) TaxID=867904 RepID=L0KWG5_METHD|nr:geranylgeranyl reductase family protein [Methanomethylovorans hollandica]AGB49777.1 geranylgeranyl reductase family protein [Methanomethylovorans hollandica DSM 15978]